MVTAARRSGGVGGSLQNGVLDLEARLSVYLLWPPGFGKSCLGTAQLCVLMSQQQGCLLPQLSRTCSRPSLGWRWQGGLGALCASGSCPSWALTGWKKRRRPRLAEQGLSSLCPPCKVSLSITVHRTLASPAPCLVLSWVPPSLHKIPFSVCISHHVFLLPLSARATRRVCE